VADALADARRLNQAGQFAEALRSIDRGIELSRPLVGSSVRRQEFDRQRSIATRGEKAKGLHRLADLLRFRAGSGTLAISGPVEDRCRVIHADWANLNRDSAGRLDEPTERRIAEDLAELARVLPDAPGLPIESSSRPFDDHREQGRALLQAGEFEAASQAFRRAVDLDPRDFWSNFHEGTCDYRLGRFQDALAAFRACVSLEPSTAECYFNRALVLEALGKPEQAGADYSRAIEHDPSLAAAYLNRGILAYRETRLAEALKDFTRGLETHPDRDLAASLHYNQALAQIALKRDEDARKSLSEAARLGNPDAAKLLETGIKPRNSR
jgi:tetratricopeptide (TPR) repeat protein